jgi:two-component system, response regulator PdtaR
MRHYLLVDDNRAFAENLAEIIRDLGDVVSVATSGAEALELVRARKFDAMLTDMRMPVMGGAELVHCTRREDPGLPAIVVTAYSGDEDLRIARNEGLLAVLQKPVPIQQLLTLLAGARRGGLVVLVEDDVGLMDNLSEALRDCGFTAVSAGSIAETDRLGAVHPFTAIVDLRVPGGADGDSMKRVALRYPSLPQIVITAHDPAMAPIRPCALHRKPFDTRKLLADVERLYAEQRVTA